MRLLNSAAAASLTAGIFLLVSAGLGQVRVTLEEGGRGMRMNNSTFVELTQNARHDCATIDIDSFSAAAEDRTPRKVSKLQR